MNEEGHRQPSAIETLALASALSAPLAFGAVSVHVWVPLAWVWIGVGAWSLFSGRRSPSFLELSPHGTLTKIFAAIHVLFVIQLIPLPPSLLRELSPGSFAAHHIPPTGPEGWAPLTASPTGTRLAWLFFAGVHGLAITLLTGPERTRRRALPRLFWGMAGVGAFLALEGLIQAASPHPFWLYGLFPVPGAADHESGIFGPYYNRDHYSNLIAISASVTASLLASRFPSGASVGLRSLVSSADFYPLLSLAAGLLLMLAASAASGSRGGFAALGFGLLVGLGPAFRARPILAIGAVLLALATLFSTGVPFAVARLADIDFEASRLMIWRDTLRLIGFFPFFGCGIGAFAAAYWPYQRVVRYEFWPHAHNEYLQWVVEAGVFGLLVALFCARRAWLAAPRIWRNRELRPALAGLTAAAVHALVDCSLRIPANAIWTVLLAVSVAALSAAPRDHQPEGAEAPI